MIVAGCPVRDEADRVVLTILNRLLEADGYTVQIAPAGALISETIAAVVAMNPASIFVSSLEESGRARHLVKRLRAVCPGDHDHRRVLGAAALGSSFAPTSARPARTTW